MSGAEGILQRFFIYNLPNRYVWYGNFIRSFSKEIHMSFQKLLINLMTHTYHFVR